MGARLRWLSLVVLVGACGDPPSPLDVARRSDGLGVTHTVCPVGSSTSCEYASPAACAIGATVTAGDICLVLGGEFHETVTWATGNLKAGLVFRCAPGARCLIDGDGIRASAFDGYDDWVIEGFELVNTSGDAITAIRRVAAVRDCFIHDVRGRGMFQVGGVNAMTPAFVEGNVIMNTGSDGITCLTAPLGTVFVRNNLVVDSSLWGTGRGISCPGNSVVTHNTIDVRNRTAPYADVAPTGISAAVVQFNVVAGGDTSITAGSVRDHNLAWGWNAAAFSGAADAGVPVTDFTADPLFRTREDWRLSAASPAIDAGAGSLETIDLDGRARDAVPDLGAFEFNAAHVSAALRWPLREAPATPTLLGSPALALRGSGPVVGFLDVAGNTAQFRARNEDGTWRAETVQSGLGFGALSASFSRRYFAVGHEPGTGLPVVVYPQLRTGNAELHLARRLGDACGTGCASIQWTGCAAPPVKVFPSGEPFSYRLAFSPVTSLPVVVLWRQTPSGCGTNVASSSITVLEQQMNGSWTETLVASNTCGSSNLVPAFDFGFTPTGAIEVVYSRTVGTGAQALSELMLATNASGSFVSQLLPLGAGNSSGTLNGAQVAVAHKANGDLAVALQLHDSSGSWLGFLERVSGTWSTPAQRLQRLGVLPDLVGVDVAFDPVGEPIISHGSVGAMTVSRRLPARPSDAGLLAARWDIRAVDTQKDTGVTPTLLVAADGGVLMAYQQENPTRVVKVLASYDPGGLRLSAIDPLVCDQCPADPAKTVPGFCGCGYQENPGISISDTTVSEGNSGTTTLNLTVTLNHACGASVSVNWVTANGTATQGLDFNSAGGTVLFNPGQTSRPVSVTVLGDGAFEPDETVLVNLSGASAGSSIVDGQGVGTIVNDDPAPPDAGSGGGSAGGGSAAGGSAAGGAGAGGGSTAGGSAGGAGGGTAGGAGGAGAGGGSTGGGSAAGGGAGGGSAAGGGATGGGSGAGGGGAGGGSTGGGSAGGAGGGGGATGGGSGAGGAGAGGGSTGGGSAGGAGAGGGATGGGSGAGGAGAGGGSTGGGSAAGGAGAGGGTGGGSAAGGGAGGGSTAGGSGGAGAGGGSAAGGSAGGGSAGGGSAAAGGAAGGGAGGSTGGGSTGGGSAAAGGAAGGGAGGSTAGGSAGGGSTGGGSTGGGSTGGGAAGGGSAGGGAAAGGAAGGGSVGGGSAGGGSAGGGSAGGGSAGGGSAGGTAGGSGGIIDEPDAGAGGGGPQVAKGCQCGATGFDPTWLALLFGALITRTRRRHRR